MPLSHVAFRVDASSQIGTGHFMRCLSLATALKQGGAQIFFVSRTLPEHLRDMLVAREFGFVALKHGLNDTTLDNLAHAHWLGTSQQADAQDSIQALSKRDWDWLVVDHYALSESWESALRITARKILVIDDIADRRHDCDVLLDQNFYQDMDARYLGKVPAHCRLLLGPHYALLRDEFRQMQAKVKPRCGPVRRILVFFGGIDSDDHTGRTIDALSKTGITDIELDVVVGAQYPFCEQISKACELSGYNCHVQTDQMAGLMRKADLAIGAGGVATLERCAMGLPSVVLVLAENQRKSVEDLAAASTIVNLGDARKVTSSSIIKNVIQLIEDEEKRIELSEASLRLMVGSENMCITELLSS